MALLAKAPPARLATLLPDLPDHTRLRPAEVGAVMLRGRAGATGAAFNPGEMTVTRCSLRLSTGEVGHAYVQGRDKAHALRAAAIDALMQTPQAPDISTQILTPLATEAAAARTLRASKAAALALTGGFATPPTQSARAFRAILDAMARPGTILTLTGAQPPAPLSIAAGVAILTLADGTTPLHPAGAADTAALRDWVTFHTGAPLVSAEAATFADGTWQDLTPVTRFAIGLPDYPDRSATLIVELPDLSPNGAKLTGPGIAGSANLSLPETAAFQTNRALFPLGFDCLFTCTTQIAALAIKQSRGDLIEAVFLIRAYRTTLPRFGATNPVNTAAMAVDRRISATFKDLPGGQVLGPTFDYTHRLLDFKLAAEGLPPAAPTAPATPGAVPHVTGFLNRDGLIEDAPPDDTPPPDLTREPLELPASRALRLQALTRGDEGFLLSLAYSTQRSYGRTHAFVGELRIGRVAVEMDIPELGFAVEIGEVDLTECETVNQFKGSRTEPPQFTRSYGLVFGQSERKAIAMSLVDRALRWQELGEDYIGAPAQDEEFVLSHCDNIQATGFLEHIKLPHYVDFQADLELVRHKRTEALAQRKAAE